MKSVMLSVKSKQIFASFQKLSGFVYRNILRLVYPILPVFKFPQFPFSQ